MKSSDACFSRAAELAMFHSPNRRLMLSQQYFCPQDHISCCMRYWWCQAHQNRRDTEKSISCCEISLRQHTSWESPGPLSKLPYSAKTSSDSTISRFSSSERLDFQALSLLNCEIWIQLQIENKNQMRPEQLKKM
jgi:hypothetical protein